MHRLPFLALWIVGLTVIDGRADNQRFGIVKLLHDAVAHIIVEHTATQLLHPTLSTGDTTVHGFYANLHNLSFNALLLPSVFAVSLRARNVLPFLRGQPLINSTFTFLLL